MEFWFNLGRFDRNVVLHHPPETEFKPPFKKPLKLNHLKRLLRNTQRQRAHENKTHCILWHSVSNHKQHPRSLHQSVWKPVFVPLSSDFVNSVCQHWTHTHSHSHLFLNITPTLRLQLTSATHTKHLSNLFSNTHETIPK